MIGGTEEFECPYCESPVLVEYVEYEPEPDVGYRGGLEIEDVDCSCDCSLNLEEWWQACLEDRLDERLER